MNLVFGFRFNLLVLLQALQGRGGWPLSVFLTPDLIPFTGGTYFPPVQKYGQPGFKTVLLGIARQVRFCQRIKIVSTIYGACFANDSNKYYLSTLCTMTILIICFAVDGKQK